MTGVAVAAFEGNFPPFFDSFLSVHGAGVTTLLSIPLRTSIARDRELRTFLHRSFLFSRRRGRAKGNLRVRVVNHAVELIRSTSRLFEGLNCGGKRLGILLSARSVGGSRQTLVFLLSCYRGAPGKLETRNLDGKKFRSEDSSRPSASSVETATRNFPRVVRRSRHRSVLTRHADYRTLGNRVFQGIAEILGYLSTQLAKVDSV